MSEAYSVIADEEIKRDTLNHVQIIRR